MPRLSAGQRHVVRFTSTVGPSKARQSRACCCTDFLRHVLGATGTHVGCEHGVCGACTVQIDGGPARACLTLAVQVEGADIRTVEGLWMGVLIWCVYVFNMTMFADVRYAGVIFPVVGWWLYDIFYISPFLAIPYLHSVNREIFTD